MASGPLEAWRMDPDMENRDPNNVNDHLKVSWEELIGEPDHTRSLDCCWKFSFKCFNLWKTLCYCLATTFCSYCIMMYWGCYFGSVAFTHIWCYTPMIHAYKIDCLLWGKLYGFVIKTLIEPISESCGKCFSAFVK